MEGGGRFVVGLVAPIFVLAFGLDFHVATKTPPRLRTERRTVRRRLGFWGLMWVAAFRVLAFPTLGQSPLTGTNCEQWQALEMRGPAC